MNLDSAGVPTNEIPPNPYWQTGTRFNTQNLINGVDFEIENNRTIKDLNDDVLELKRMMKLMSEPDEKILKEYPILRDLYDQYRETYILIFGKDNE